MRLSPNDPLVARASSAAVKPRKPEPAELELEAWDAPAATPPEQRHPVQLGPAYLVLPYPPSANTLYRSQIIRSKKTGKHIAIPFKSTEHKKYFEAVESAVGFVAAPWPKDVELRLEVLLFRPRRVGDIDGPIKALFDALNGRVWVDDSQITDLRITRHDDKANPRVEVSIQPAAPTTE